MSDNLDRELGWEEEIENDGPEYILLPEGDYSFEVVKFERERHNGSDKLPPCPKAVVHLSISTPAGNAVVRHNLFLHSKTEGLLCAFFTGIGQRKKGEKLAMNWSKVIGSKGRAKIGIRTWTKDNGDVAEFNEVKKFYTPEDEEPVKGFTPGAF